MFTSSNRRPLLNEDLTPIRRIDCPRVGLGQSIRLASLIRFTGHGLSTRVGLKSVVMFSLHEIPNMELCVEWN